MAVDFGLFANRRRSAAIQTDVCTRTCTRKSPISMREGHRTHRSGPESFRPRRPSLDYWRVGSCIPCFGACSAFTSITACMIAKLPMQPSTPKAPADSLPPLPLRLLPCGAIQFPGGICTHCGPAPCTAHSNFWVVHKPEITGAFLGPTPVLLRMHSAQPSATATSGSIRC